MAENMAKRDRAEFDDFASTYRDLHAGSIRLSGEDPDYFARYKVQEVARTTSGLGCTHSRQIILDFGCGVGGTLPHLSDYFPEAEIHGVDVSEESIQLAQERYGRIATLASFDGSRLPYADHSFDLVFTSCVFHHIEPSNWLTSMQEIRRVLRPSGDLFIFEHNPWNPLTRKVVRDCPFDKNAVLLTAKKVEELARHAGFKKPAARYTVFFPHSLSMLRPLERFLAVLPIGAQYYVRAQY